MTAARSEAAGSAPASIAGARGAGAVAGGNAMPSACFVTPSYSADFERCRLLVESRRICAPEMEHFLIVDPPDVARFASLADANTRIVDSRELLDAELHKLWGDNGWWFGRRVPPLRGWITQQLRKLAMPRLAGHEVLVNVDSDVVFVRRFDPAMLFDGDGRLGLFAVDYRNEEIRRWSADAAGLIGCAAPQDPFNYVGMMIGWWSAHARALTARIEARAGLPWQVALGRRKSFSEYMLYGTYARHALGLEEARHFSDARMLVQTSWHKDTRTIAGLEALFTQLPPEAVAVMVHSKDGVDPEAYARLTRQMWARL